MRMPRVSAPLIGEKSHSRRFSHHFQGFRDAAGCIHETAFGLQHIRVRERFAGFVVKLRLCLLAFRRLGRVWILVFGCLGDILLCFAYPLPVFACGCQRFSAAEIIDGNGRPYRRIQLLDDCRLACDCGRGYRLWCIADTGQRLLIALGAWAIRIDHAALRTGALVYLCLCRKSHHEQSKVRYQYRHIGYLDAIKH